MAAVAVAVVMCVLPCAEEGVGLASGAIGGGAPLALPNSTHVPRERRLAMLVSHVVSLLPVTQPIRANANEMVQS